jgi:large subunit ribosomal protein L31e
VKDFAKKAMKTSEVRVDVKLNKFLWSKGIRNVRARRCCLAPCPAAATLPAEPRAPAPPQVPRRVRVQISRRRNDDEDAKARARSRSARRGDK